jgi:DNA-binding Lrp family transcriptional regulator
MLDTLGISPVEERLYRELLRRPHAPLAELAAAGGISTGQARRAVAGLTRAGLVSRRSGSPRLIPAPPDVAVEALIARRTEELGRARLAAAGLLDEYRQGARRDSAAELVEVITGREAIQQRSVQLLRSARQEVLMFDKPPYIGPLDNPIEFELLAQDVRWQAVYAPEGLDPPGRLAQVRDLQRAGERSRIAPGLPLKLAIADRRLALLPLTTDGDEQEMAILVHPCSLLTTLVTLFELFWQRGLPLPGEEPAGTYRWSANPADRTLLTLLTAGATDETIARQLGISVRTARRRMAELMHANGVRTRFQLGLIAGRQLRD